MNDFELGQDVAWNGEIGTIVGLSGDPTAIVQFRSGARYQVLVSLLGPAPEREVSREENFVAASIFSQLQVQLISDPFPHHGPTATKRERAFRKGFRAGLGLALQWVSEACRAGRTMDEAVAEIQRETAERVLTRVRAVHDSALGQIPARVVGPEMDAIARDFGADQ